MDEPITVTLPAPLPTSLQVMDAPIPLSFPSILRNPGIKERYAHLNQSTTNGSRNIPSGRAVYKKRDDNEGRRWIRRKENAFFVGNPHIIAATKKDYTLQLKPAKMTFPVPLPPYLPRTAKLPTTQAPITDPVSANAGRFSLSIKGMRKDLRRGGMKVQNLVRQVEVQIIEWLETVSITMNPDLVESTDYTAVTGHPIADSVVELSRTPQQLIWHIPDDGFARYVVHCCARFHSVVSFSKEISGLRLTFLLRPNVTRPDRQAAAALDTPPITDIESSRFDSDSEFASSAFADSDIDATHDLSDIESLDERSVSESGGWSMVPRGELESLSDVADGELSEVEMVQQFEGVSLGDDPDRTLEAIPQSFRLEASSRWQSPRHNSSPSRSPAPPRRPLLRPLSDGNAAKHAKTSETLYAYLYS